MKIRSLILYICAFFFSLSLNAQDKDFLLKVNDRKVSAEEFKWLYQKNNSGLQQSGIEEYMDLYINLRLKVEAAEEAGMHKRQSFINELKGYRKQLAKQYLTDSEAKEKILKKAYERYKTEINVYHILVKCPANAPPADTLQAYRKAKSIKQRLRLGEPFEAVAKGASDDPAAKLNGGNLGYLTVFQTPMSFENKMYEMSPGEISEPVRTSMGYHLIKVQDKRKNRGRIKVAHIMKAAPPGSTQQARDNAKEEIDSLYNLLEKGADFADLASENSDDRRSAQNNGVLPWFGSGEMIHEFSVAAFELLRDGEYTPPVRTVYGWHIIKRLDKKVFPAYEEAKKLLESKLPDSYLQSLTKLSFADKLKEEYNYELNPSSLEWFYMHADSSLRYQRDYEALNNVPDKVLYSFADERCSMPDFASYIRQNHDQAPVYEPAEFINKLLEKKVYEHLTAYESSVLEDKYPEFHFLMNEFYDGILFFEISDSLIWKRSRNDSTGIMEYYDKRKDEFTKEAYADLRLYTISDDAGRRHTRKIKRAIRRFHKRDNYYEKIMEKSTFGGDTLLQAEEKSFKRSNSFLKNNNIKWKEGLQEVTNMNGTIVVDILEIHERKYKEAESIMNILVPDYQEYLESQWIRKLKNTYPVELNKKMLKRIKSDIKK